MKVSRRVALKSRPAASKPAKTPATIPIYKNPGAPAVKRVKDLLGRMTLEGQAAQMMCVWQEKAQKLL